MKSIKFLEDNGIDIKNSLGIFGSQEIYNEKLGEFLVGVHTKIKQSHLYKRKKH